MSIPQYSIDYSEPSEPNNVTTANQSQKSASNAIQTIKLSQLQYQNLVTKVLEVSHFQLCQGIYLAIHVFFEFLAQILTNIGLPKTDIYLTKGGLDKYLQRQGDDFDLQLLTVCTILSLGTASAVSSTIQTMTNNIYANHSKDQVEALANKIYQLQAEVQTKTPYCYLKESGFSLPIQDSIENLIDYSLIIWNTVNLTAKERFLVCLHIFLQKNMLSFQTSSLSEKLIQCKEAIKHSLDQDCLY